MPVLGFQSIRLSLQQSFWSDDQTVFLYFSKQKVFVFFKAEKAEFISNKVHFSAVKKKIKNYLSRNL